METRKASLAQGEGPARARKTKGRFHHKETSVRPDVGGGGQDGEQLGEKNSQR